MTASICLIHKDLLFAVLFDVSLSSFFDVMLSVMRVTAGGMSMMGGLFVMPALIVFGCFVMMMCSMFVVLCCLLMVLGCFLRHGYFLGCGVFHQRGPRWK